MLQSHLQAPPLRTKPDPLVPSIDRLRRAVAADAPGREREWAETVESALALVEKSLRQHLVVAEAPDGLFAEVDATRPTLTRQVDELCSEHGNYLKQVLALRETVQCIAEAFNPALCRTAQARSRSIPDFAAIRKQAEQLMMG